MRRRVVAVAAVVVLLAVGVVGGAAVLVPRLAVAPEPGLEKAATRDQGASEEPEAVEPIVEKPAPEPEPPAEPEPAFDASAPDVTAAGATGLTATAPEGFLATRAFAQVETEIQALTDRGVSVGLSLTDLECGRSLAYNADERFYPASSIKALYCTMVCETQGGPGTLAGQMEQCLVNSSNEDYEALIDTYGMRAFGSWLAAHGAPTAAADGSYYYYPWISAGELATAWQEIYRYGTSGEAGSAELVSYLSCTSTTPTAELLRETCDVWSKAGWFPATEDGLDASVDAGVVFAESGTYVLAVMTDMSSNLEGLKPLIGALDAAHATLVTGVDVAEA